MSDTKPRKKTELAWEKAAPGVLILHGNIDRDSALKMMEARRMATEMRHSGGKTILKKKGRSST